MAGPDVSFRFVPDPRGMADVAVMAPMRTHMATTAEKYRAGVTANYPKNTGRQAGQVATGETGTDRAGAYATVTTTSSKWHWVEFGTIHQPPRAPWRRTATALGLRWQSVGRQ